KTKALINVNSSNDIPDCLAKTPYVMAIGIYPNIIGKPTTKPFLIISIDWFVFCVVACDCPIKALPPFCVEKFKLLYHITKMNNRWDGRYMGKFTSLLRKGNRSFTY